MKKIVIVDRYQGIKEMLLLAFEELSIKANRIEMFSDPTKALRHIDANGALLVIASAETGNTSGIDLVKMLQLSDSTVPVIVTSIYSSNERKALDLGAHSFFRKPFNIFSMLDTCESILTPQTL